MLCLLSRVTGLRAFFLCQLESGKLPTQQGYQTADLWSLGCFLYDIATATPGGMFGTVGSIRSYRYGKLLPFVQVILD
jgi:hypothetical protein